MGTILTGLAVSEISMPEGGDLTGYIARTSSAQGIHDALKIKCMILSDGSTSLVIVSCAVLALSTRFVQNTSEQLENLINIPKENIIISCTHTHSGPASVFLQDCGEVNPDWLKDLQSRIINCVQKAACCLKTSRIEYRTGTCSISMNRVRFQDWGGKESVYWEANSGIKEYFASEGANTDNPDVPEMRFTDKQVGILCIQDAEKKEIKAILVNYACHPVTLEHTNLLYSADYLYYMEKALVNTFGGNTEIFFCNGCCGDLDHVASLYCSFDGRYP